MRRPPASNPGLGPGLGHGDQPAVPVARPMQDRAIMRARIVASDDDMCFHRRVQGVQTQPRCGRATGQPTAELGSDQDVGRSVREGVDGTHAQQISRPHGRSQSTIRDAIVPQAFPPRRATKGCDGLCRIHANEPGVFGRHRGPRRVLLWTDRPCAHATFRLGPSDPGTQLGRQIAAVAGFAAPPSRPHRLCS